MISAKLTRTQYKILQGLTRKELGTLRKYPKILAESRELLRACKKVVKKIADIPEHANRRKRQTAYKRIAAICQKAVDKVEK